MAKITFGKNNDKRIKKGILYVDFIFILVECRWINRIYIENKEKIIRVKVLK